MSTHQPRITMKKFFLCTSLALFAAQAWAAPDMLALAKQKNCLACHAVDAKIVGPAYKAVAEKYAGKPGAEQMLVNAVLHGHVGTWGQVPMPANTDVTPAQAKQLVAWILSLK
ncbi:Cytochrome c-551 [Thiomonas arsenitoxydans]|uniref:Cytochrome c-551 n=4 Tax=Thiomonas TaxID=32012 RepID=A0A238D6Z4_THIDL|nr:Cytochrome c-551 [Thiomonas arsenitoxydans]CQR42387.1 Cytochrome c-551 [Thiomonas sp. CB3]SBP86354.1 Cytochrome c-551 [Thiomonas delicata]CQR36324.1 Cytochrome c-551 [Thiomonas arsenitoxydans]CQR39378.1 Cytochrome c-551 [Thiomonas arsenitoxydans]